MPVRTWIRSASMAAAAALLIAACSSGSPSDSPSTGAKSTPAGSASPAGSRTAFCNTARRYWSDRLVIAQGESKNKTPNMSSMPGNMSSVPAQRTGAASRQATLQAARAIQATLPPLETTAPANLQAAVRTFVAAEKPYIDALVNANGDESKLPPTYMAKSMSALNSPEGKALTGYWSRTCGISLGRAAEHQ
jgi:hypothetical protein